MSKFKKYALFQAFGYTFILGNSVANGATVSINSTQFLSGASVIDFEEGNTTALPDIEGVTFVREGLSFSGSKNFDGYFGEKSFSNLVSSNYTNLAIEFDNPQQAVGSWVGQIPNTTNTMPEYIRFAVYDADSNLLAEGKLDMALELNNWSFIGFASDEGISRVEWLVDNQGFFGVDNITYGAAVVPLPPSGLLFLSSIAAFFGIAKRKTTNKA